MSKKSSVPTVLSGTPMDARVIYDYQIQRLEGQLLTFIESLGLKESQEKSAKEIFRDILYRATYSDLVWVPGESIGPVVMKAYEEARAEGRPPFLSSQNNRPIQ